MSPSLSAEAIDFRGPWFTSRVACAYVGSKSLKAYYVWRRRHHVIPRNNGTVAKADLDRVLRQPRRRNRMAPASLANLRKRWTAEPEAETQA